MCGGNTRSGLFNQFLEFLSIQIAEHHARRSIRKIRKGLLDLRVHTPAGHEQIRPEARVGRDVDPVEHLAPLAARLVDGRHQVVRGQPELRRRDVVEPADLIAAPVGQPRVLRGRHAVRREIGGADVEVVGGREMTLRAPVIRDLGRDARQQRVRHRRRDLPVVAAVIEAGDRLGIVARCDVHLAEARVAERPELAHLRNAVAVQVLPAARRGVHRRVEGIQGARGADG